MKQLSKEALAGISQAENLFLPAANVFSLPEKVLQFGTGVLLRGLPDYLINNANNKGIFNGRIVVVKSTEGGDDAALYNTQNGLYTLCIRGVAENKTINQIHICAAISRVLSAAVEWEEILLCAENPEMEVVISNTTEVGITLVKDNIHSSPPVSFPGKLLAFLYHRFKFFDKRFDKGMVIVPTELVPNNGEKLLSIVLELAHQNGLEADFIDWLEAANQFCNSLVDRIVPGKLNKDEQGKIIAATGCADELMIMSEVYALWAIESANEKVKKVLSFADDTNIFIEKDIDKFRELKLRLLNGSHTFACGLAFLAGCSNVKEAMDNKLLYSFIEQLMYNEIIPAIVSDHINIDEAKLFAAQVLDRYKNEFIDHKWISITAQYSSKMQLRNLDTIHNYYAACKQVPALMSMGFAAHILFMKCEQENDGAFYGCLNGTKYLITDAHAAMYENSWKQFDGQFLVADILGKNELWQTDLNALPGFAEEVSHQLKSLQKNGILHTLLNLHSDKKVVENDK